MQLRGYQKEAIDAVLTARRQGMRRLLLALPTGAGKTVIFAELIRRARSGVLVLAHRDELVAQAEAKIAAALEGSGRRVALEQGSRRAPPDADVMVASIRSLHPERLGRALAGRAIRLVVYDECHHAVADENLRLLRALGVFHEDWPGTLVGCTATTRRADGRALSEVFETIVYERSIRTMIDDGYLRPLRGVRIDTRWRIQATGFDVDDFEDALLDEQIDVQERNLLVARSIQELTRDRRTIAFCGSVKHAEHLSQALRELGVRSGVVCGAMPKPDRARTLRWFREGRLSVITNVGVLTEGFDDPGVSAIAMVRPTRSESLYLQCVGRGMRPSPDASDCLVLDFVDLSDLELVTAQSLDAGPKRDLEGNRAQATGLNMAQDVDPSFDEAPATLEEIQERLASFDPLTMVQSEEASAISPYAWISLGARGMVLHFLDRRGAFACFELRPGPRRGATVWLGDRSFGRFSTTQAAIEAVDHELARFGDPASAEASAAWRKAPITPALQRALDVLSPPRIARTIGEALAHLALAQGAPPSDHKR